MTLAVDTSTVDLLEMTPRVARIQQRIMETMLSQIAPWGDGLTIFDGDEAANEALRAGPMIVREAMAFHKLLSEMPIRVQPDEFFVGTLVQTQANRGKPFPDYATYEEKKHANRKGIAVFPSWGHYPPNYRRMLQFGLSGLEAQACRSLAALSPATDPEGRKRNFYEAILVAFDGVRHYVRRHQDAAREQLADESDPQRREELGRIITTLDRVPEYPAETFYEACQSFWITFATLQNMGNSTPIGRWDQFMYPYFERDLSAGRLTLDAAQEMVDCLWMKFNERARFLPLVYRDAEPFKGLWSPNSSKEYYKPSVAFIHFGDNAVERDTSNPAQFVHWLQNIIVGGQTRDGRDGTNELTYMAIAASRKSPFSQPIVSVRFWSGSPRELFEAACELARTGSAMPPMFNDEVIVPAYVKAGFPIEDARDYTNDGCWETLIGGQTEFRWNPIHALQNLEAVLNRGASRLTGERIGLDQGDARDWTSFESVMEAYKRQLDETVHHSVRSTSATYGELYHIQPVPYLSAMLEGPMNKGKDITEGGANYIIQAPLLSGGSNAADALMAIKKLVFEDQRVTMGELLDALDAGWEGHEDLRHMFIHEAPKFGNDEDEVDRIAADVLEYFAARVHHYDKVYRHPEHTQLRFLPGTGTFEQYRIFGKKVGATPDGRRPEEWIATDFSPVPGRDIRGPIAAITSFAKVDHTLLTDGSEFNLSLSRGAYDGPEGLDRLIHLVDLFMRSGGCILCLSMNEPDELRAAMREPEKWTHLRVRMGGWPAYFCCLDREHQEHHLARYLQNEIA